jgi:hypothetical protein
LVSDLLSLGVLEAKGFEFQGKNGWLTVIDEDGDALLQARRQNNVYSLNKPHYAMFRSLRLRKEHSISIRHEPECSLEPFEFLDLSRFIRRRTRSPPSPPPPSPKARNSRPTAAQESTTDADLLINSERLRRIDDLFIEPDRLFKAHARAIERKENDENEEN